MATRNTPKVAEVLAAEAKTENVEDRMVKFEFDGVDYEVSEEILGELDVMEALEDGKLLTPVKLCLGPKQWAKFREKKRTVDDLAKITETMFTAMGVDLGEFSG